MTNMEYILLNASDNDFANILQIAFGYRNAQDHTELSSRIQNAILNYEMSRGDYWSDTIQLKQTRLINVWLSLQYNQEEWDRED